jgi:AcrR family transcriptional regulator
VTGTTETDPPRRIASPARAERIDALVDAALDELRSGGYDDFTVRKAARRAGIGSATAYTYFSSKDHLVAEVCWRFLRPLEPPDPSLPPADRLRAALATLADLIASEPEAAAASMVAVLAPDPDVERLRTEIGDHVIGYFAAALGDDADAARLLTLNLALVGALHQVSAGVLAHADLPAVFASIATVVVGSPDR